MLQQVKEELKLYRDDLKNIDKRYAQCAFNSLAFIVQSKFKYQNLHLTGHSLCINQTTLVDPTVGCAWFYKGSYVDLIKNILNKKIKPHYTAEWFEEPIYKFWWDYTYKYNNSLKNGTLQQDWDVQIKAVITYMSGVEVKSLGKFSDYV